MTVFLLLLALAQPAGDKDAAAQLVDEGIAAFQAEDYEGALAKFEAAHARFPSPKILLNLAEAHRAAGHPARAVRRYEQFLRDADAPSAGLVSSVRDRLAELEPEVGRMTLLGVMDSAEVTLDGEVWPAPRSRRAVTAGPHDIGIRAPGYLPWSKVATVTKRATVELRPTLAPKTLAESAPAEPVDESQDGLPWLWIGIGVAAVAVATGVAVAATTGGDDFIPGGELGRSSTSEWGQP